MRLARFASRYGAALFVLGLLMMGTPLLSHQPEARAAGGCTVGDFSLDAEERRFVELLNDYRVQHGLKTLTVSESLTRAAAWFVIDLSAKNYFSHTDSLGRSPQVRVTDCGYGSPAGENIAAGTDWDTAQEAFDAWKKSPGHNENMLYAEYAQVGVARVYSAVAQYGWYWATDFGTVDDGTNMLAPIPTPALPTLPPAAPTTPLPTSTAPPPPPSTPTPTPSPAPTLTPFPTVTPVPTLVATATPSPSPVQGVELLNIQPGANLIAWPGHQTPPSQIGSDNAAIDVIYAYDPATQTWLRFGPRLPLYANSLQQLEPGQAYWILASQAAQVFASR